jgi:hypothetical protein
MALMMMMMIITGTTKRIYGVMVKVVPVVN